MDGTLFRDQHKFASSMTDAAQALTLAARGWPHIIGAGASAVEITSGLSDAPLWKMESQQGAFALREWPSDQHRQVQLAHRLLFHLQQRRAGWTPCPLRVDATGGTLFASNGTHWELAPWLPGDSSFDSHPSLVKLKSACRALAEFHQLAAEVPVEPDASQSSTLRHMRGLEQLAGQLSKGFFATAEKPMVDALRAGVTLAKEKLAPLASTQLAIQLTWGDAWHANFLFQGDEVSGLVDFATVRIDTPAADLARLLGSATSENRDWWLAGVEAYAAVRPISTIERQATKAFDASGAVLSLANWARWLVVERRVFRDQPKARGRLEHFAARLERLLQQGF